MDHQDRRQYEQRVLALYKSATNTVVGWCIVCSETDQFDSTERRNQTVTQKDDNSRLSRHPAMPRLTHVQAVLLVSYALPMLVFAQDQSNFLLDFLALNVGFFDNLRQTQTGGSDNLRVTMKRVNVDVPVLRPAPVYYTELAVEGEVQTMLLGAVYERPGPTIEVRLYNFTNPSLFKPGEFDVSTLYHLKKEQLSGGNCTAIFKRLTRTTYVGSFPDCKNSIEGNNPSYGDTFVCNRNSFVFPPTVPGYSKTPYILDRTGDRESTASFPDTFDRICGQPGQVTRRYK